VRSWIYIGAGVAVAGAAAYFLIKPSSEVVLQEQMQRAQSEWI